ncbi:MAG: hypothetical protein KTR25_18695 [Myxococcales bacterium]|nr:hypothetical protein [Myxococcales bacterium]
MHATNAITDLEDTPQCVVRGRLRSSGWPVHDLVMLAVLNLLERDGPAILKRDGPAIPARNSTDEIPERNGIEIHLRNVPAMSDGL